MQLSGSSTTNSRRYNFIQGLFDTGSQAVSISLALWPSCREYTNHFQAELLAKAKKEDEESEKKEQILQLQKDLKKATKTLQKRKETSANLKKVYS